MCQVSLIGTVGSHFLDIFLTFERPPVSSATSAMPLTLSIRTMNVSIVIRIKINMIGHRVQKVRVAKATGFIAMETRFVMAKEDVRGVAIPARM